MASLCSRFANGGDIPDRDLDPAIVDEYNRVNRLEYDCWRNLLELHRMYQPHRIVRGGNIQFDELDRDSR